MNYDGKYYVKVYGILQKYFSENGICDIIIDMIDDVVEKDDVVENLQRKVDEFERRRELNNLFF